MVGATIAQRRARALLPMVGLLSGLGATTLAIACNDDNNLVGPIVTGAVATFADSTFNFQTLRTFAMPDTVIHFNPVTGTPLDVPRTFDRVALDQVRQDFLARGYTEVADPRTVTPDFVVLVGATATTNYNAWVSYSWFGVWGFSPVWGWYRPGFTPAWGILFPWGATVGVTAYDRGTLVVTLIPTKSVNPVTTSIRAAWAGVATTLLTGSVTSATVQAAIDEMFRQSPYLTAPSP